MARDGKVGRRSGPGALGAMRQSTWLVVASQKRVGCGEEAASPSVIGQRDRAAEGVVRPKRQRERFGTALAVA